MIQIDKNVPMPAKSKPGSITKYPWEQMDVGDSFPYKGIMLSATSMVSAQNRVQSMANSGKLFAARRMPDGKPRIWRLT